MSKAADPNIDDIVSAFFNSWIDFSATLPNPSRPKQSEPFCRTSPTRRSGRRTKAEIEAIRNEMFCIIADHRPMTVRQIFYQLVSRGVIAKTEGEYKSTVCRLLSLMRREGGLPYDWIADNTRWMRKPRTYSSVEQMLERTQETYRRSVWENQDVYVEIWLEKEALAGVLVDVTSKWDVPLMVTRGYPSLSFVHSAAEQIQYEEKPTYLYYFGDHDPSGIDIPRFVEDSIREICGHNLDLHFERVAVLPDQIIEYHLQTRPTKRSDSRSKTFKGESVEVDAIAPDTLREICEHCIVQHIDQDAYQRMLDVEAAERDTLATVVENLGGAA